MNHREQIIGFLLEEILDDVAELPADADLLDGLVDSLTMVRLVDFIEETLHIVVPPEDFTVEHFRSVNDIVAYLERRQP